MWQTRGNRWCSIWKFSPPTNHDTSRLRRAKSTVVSTWCAAQAAAIRPVSGRGSGQSASSPQWATRNTTRRATPPTNHAATPTRNTDHAPAAPRTDAPRRVPPQRDAPPRRPDPPLAGEDLPQAPAPRPRQPVAVDPAGEYTPEVVIELPLQRQQAVQRPQVPVLQPVE